MRSFDFKKLLPHIYILIGFIVLSFLFGYPQLEGLTLQQGDIVSWKAMSHEGMEWHEKTGEEVLWSNSMFGGMPTFTYYLGEHSNLFYYIQDTIMNILGKPACFLFLAMLGFYVIGLALGFNRWLNIAGSVAYAFSTYNITLIEAGHETKMLALAYMPMVMAGLILLYRGRYWAGAPLLGVAMAFIMTTSHYQVIYYLIIIIIGMVITFFTIALKQQNLKRFFIASAIAVVMAAIGCGPNMQVFLTTVQYNKTTMRGGESELTINHDKDKKGGGLDKDYAFGWSNAWGESFTVLVPFIYGGASAENLGEESETYETMTNIGVPAQSAIGFAENLPTYWGPQPFTGGPFYFGAIICFLFVLSVIVVKSPHKWWIIAISLLAFLMSVGKHFPSFNYFLFDNLPAFNKFRVPNMILVVPQLLFPLFAIWGLNDIITKGMEREELWKKVKLAGIITGGLCLLLGLGAGMFFDFKANSDVQIQAQLTQSFQNEDAANQVMAAIRSDRQSMATTSGLVSAFLVLLIVGLLWAYYKQKIKAMHLALAITALVAIDLIRVDSRYLNEENYTDPDAYESLFAPRPVDQQVHDMDGGDPYYRVLDLSVNTNNNAVQAVHHKAIGGYSPAKMEIYQDMIDVHMGRQYNSAVLNMLNTRFIISPQGQGGQPVAIPNQEACGNAWFVNEIQWEETADDEILALNAEQLGSQDTMADAFRPLQTAVLRTKYKDEIGKTTYTKDSSAFVKLDQYGLNNISYYSKNSNEGFAVFSDIYYPYGWKAYVDGAETPIYKANYILRALKLPAGEHKIEFKFHPQRFYTGDTIAIITCVLLLLSVAVSIFMMMKEEKKPAS